MTFDAQIVIGAFAILATAEFAFIIYLVRLIVKQGSKFEDMVHIEHLKSAGRVLYPEVKKIAENFAAGTPTQVDNFVIKQAGDAIESFLEVKPTVTVGTPDISSATYPPTSS